jgi:hypothetical protein
MSQIVFHRDRGLKQVVASALSDAAPFGVDSVDLLVAAVDTREGSDLLARLGVNVPTLRDAVRASRSRPAEPGLSDDAKRVIEAASMWALERERGPDLQDLLIGIAKANCRGRDVLNNCGIDEERLVGLAG